MRMRVIRGKMSTFAHQKKHIRKEKNKTTMAEAIDIRELNNKVDSCRTSCRAWIR